MFPRGDILVGYGACCGLYPVRCYGRTRRSLLAYSHTFSMRRSWNVFQPFRPPPRTSRRLSEGRIRTYFFPVIAFNYKNVQRANAR